MVKITGKRSDTVKKIINFMLKRGSTVNQNCVKTQNLHIQVPKKHVKKQLKLFGFPQPITPLFFYKIK